MLLVVAVSAAHTEQAPFRRESPGITGGGIVCGFIEILILREADEAPVARPNGRARRCGADSRRPASARGGLNGAVAWRFQLRCFGGGDDGQYCDLPR
jgi:hypothetical protein